MQQHLQLMQARTLPKELRAQLQEIAVLALLVGCFPIKMCLFQSFTATEHLASRPFPVSLSPSLHSLLCLLSAVSSLLVSTFHSSFPHCFLFLIPLPLPLPWMSSSRL